MSARANRPLSHHKIGKRISVLREHLGEDPRSFAKRLSISVEQLKIIESGLIDPQEDIIEKILDNTSVSAQWLMIDQMPLYPIDFLR